MFAPSAALRSLRRVVVPGVALAFAPAALAGNVLTVGGTGGDFSDIQSAVTAAADGDVILVRSGTYPGFAIGDRSLSVVADSAATVVLTSQVAIQGVSSGKKIVLAGLSVQSLAAGNDAFLYLNGNAGSVRVQSCDFGRSDMRHGYAVYDQVSSDVAFVDCTLQGADGYYADGSGFHYGGGHGWTALWVVGGQVALYDCDVDGGLGEDGEDQLGISGGAGGFGCFLQEGAFLFSSGTTFRGAHGGDGSSAFACTDDPAGDGGDGGDGIGSLGGVHVALLDCTTVAGAAGAGGTDTCGPGGSPGLAGSAIDLGASSTLDQLPGSARRLVMPTPVRESTPIALTLTGVPGEVVYLTMWTDTRFLYSPAMSGTLLEKAPLIRRVRLGVIPATGTLIKNVALPDLGPGVQGKTYFFQAYFLGPANAVTLGSPAFVVELDSAF